MSGSMDVITHIPVKMQGKIVGTGRLTSNGELYVKFDLASTSWIVNGIKWCVEHNLINGLDISPSFILAQAPEIPEKTLPKIREILSEIGFEDSQIIEINRILKQNNITIKEREDG